VVEVNWPLVFILKSAYKNTENAQGGNIKAIAVLSDYGEWYMC
jgi:hypothetical protein